MSTITRWEPTMVTIHVPGSASFVRNAARAAIVFASSAARLTGGTSG
jgi:hypothetical protein